MIESDVAKLEEQANARIETQHINKNAPGISMCTVTPHQLLELTAAWHIVYKAMTEPPKEDPS